MSLWDLASERIAAGQVCALVTVIAVQGSAPREAGAQMLVWPDGQAGTVGGGNLEFQLASQARRMLASGDGFAVQDYPLGPLLAQCCGGKVRVLLERLDRSHRAFLGTVRGLEAEGRAHLIETAIAAGALRKSVLDMGEEELTFSVTLFDRMGRPLDPKAAPHADFTMIQAIHPQPPNLLMFGAGHVGQAVARIAATLPVALRWIDSREDYRGRSSGGIEPNILADPVAAIAVTKPDSLYLIFTHSHALDYALARAVLARGDFRYCGVIGSATKRARFAHRLVADGIAPDTVARLVCPIGAIGLKSKAPEALAIAVAAELLLALEGIPTSAFAKAPHGH